MPLRIAIIGSGPSGFYAAQALFKERQDVCVDMFEKLPTPFGLLRAGVAPDHQQMKTVAKAYHKIAQHNGFRFFGNVTIGTDISIKQLRSYYHGIIVASGAETDRKMNIDGESANGSQTATEFVGWYNCHPSYQDRRFDLSKPSVVIIGQGNVAVDVTRVLSKPVDSLASSDISSAAIDALRDSKVSDVYMIGRRGPAQSAFTNLELNELGNIPGVRVVVHDDLVLSRSDEEELALSSKARKNIETLRVVKEKDWGDAWTKTIHIMHYLSPKKVLVNDDNGVVGVQFEQTRLIGDAMKQRAVGTGQHHTIDCGLVLRSIGYEGVSFPGIPFDEKACVIPSTKGQVCQGKSHDPQLFVTGWIKRGPSGVIGTNRSDSIETVQTLLNTLPQALPSINTDITDYLDTLNIRVISYKDWERIDAYEIRNGKKKGKIREKVVNIHDIFSMLDQQSAELDA